ncbi:hypothetical protein G6F65_012803 [Rhizopus arrhizus]|nr:hypothetical protein G6F65_012803 [Rhizopus arrhizus]
MDWCGTTDTVKGPIDPHPGVAVPSSLDARIAALMCRFSQLTPLAQRRFTELLNAYLYASTAQRRRLRLRWQAQQFNECDDDVKNSN